MGADQPVKEITKNGFTLKIYQDDQGDSPREWDNLGTLVTSHPRYKIGEVQAQNTKLYNNWNAWFRKEIVSLHGEHNLIWYPVYLYDHSGITISITPFGCQWDSGQVGWIYTTKQKMREQFGISKVTKRFLKTAHKILENEIKTCDQYLRGDVYGFVYEQEIACDTCGHIANEHIDSCWGFYGDNWLKNGMPEHMPEEAIPLLKELCEC